jgi:hypothetical protein
MQNHDFHRHHRRKGQFRHRLSRARTREAQEAANSNTPKAALVAHLCRRTGLRKSICEGLLRQSVRIGKSGETTPNMSLTNIELEGKCLMAL